MTMATDDSFVFFSLPGRVVFGAGCLSTLPQEVQALGAQRALVLCTPEQRGVAEQVSQQLGARSAGIFDQAVMHVPIETARLARTRAAELGADLAVAVGGGSTIGLGKAIALDSGLPIIAIPTTYAGSEMTTIFGITEGGIKKTGRDPKVLPRTVLYDPTLTQTLPIGLSVTSCMNAIAHAAEGLYAPDGNPIMGLMAEAGIAAIAKALPRVCANGKDLSARTDALYGAWLCGKVLGHVAMSLHHKLCHTLGGTFNLPHAETHTVVLPQALAYNTSAAPAAMARMARALGSTTAAQGVFDLAQKHGAPVSLRELGLQVSDLDRACDLALENQYQNPRPLERAAIRQLLQDAFDGRRPSV
jgi:maleylacetate reductase